MANVNGLKILGRLPVDPKLAAACDKGVIELFEGDWLDQAADEIEEKMQGGTGIKAAKKKLPGEDTFSRKLFQVYWHVFS